MRKISLTVIFMIIFSKSFFPQNWLPLEVGNTLQFIKSNASGTSFLNATYTFSLSEIYIDRDTIIDDNRYFFWLTKCVRYSEEEKKAYVWLDTTDGVYMDFNKTSGDTFHFGSLIYNIVTGNIGLFGNILQYKGFERTSVNPPHYTVRTDRVYFAPGIGWCYFSISSSNVYYFSSSSDNLLMGILYDSEGNETFLTNNFKPVINFEPKLSANKRLFILYFTISHEFNIYPSANSSGLSFIDSVIMESYYSKGDSVITLPSKVAYGNPVGNYSFTTLLDTSKMKDGYSFNYRFIAKDKGIIPETSFSPDSGYYRCVWDFSTTVGNETLPVSGFALHQNFPNPFNPSTVIGYQLPVSSDVTLKVFDVLGREVATLVDEYKEAGYHEVEFHPASGIGHPVSGVYFYQLQAGSYIETKKMILLR